jgi:hypothetical protein
MTIWSFLGFGPCEICGKITTEYVSVRRPNPLNSFSYFHWKCERDRWDKEAIYVKGVGKVDKFFAGGFVEDWNGKVHRLPEK